MFSIQVDNGLVAVVATQLGERSDDRTQELDLILGEFGLETHTSFFACTIELDGVLALLLPSLA